MKEVYLLAIPYRIKAGKEVRDLYEAAITINEQITTKDVRFITKSGISSYFKSLIGKDNTIKSLNERSGFMVKHQIANDDNYKTIKLHIPVTKKGTYVSFNAILLLAEYVEDSKVRQIRPIRLVSMEELYAKEPTHINIDVGYNKIPRDILLEMVDKISKAKGELKYENIGYLL